MPTELTYPGVYVEELPSGVRSIVGVATSITAFVGRAWRGPVDDPVMLFSYADFERRFGGLWRQSTLGYSVQQFFVNGGSRALVVRAFTRGDGGAIDEASAATIDLGGGNILVAANPGTWGRNLIAYVNHLTKDEADNQLFNLRIVDDPDRKEDDRKLGGSGAVETFRNVSMDDQSPRFVTKVLQEQSALVRLSALGAARPDAGTDPNDEDFPDAAYPAEVASGDDGDDLVDSDVVGSEAGKTGIYALKKADIFNLLCLPPLTPGAEGTDIALDTWTKAAAYCKERRAFLIVDSPVAWDVDTAVDDVDDFSAIDRDHAALYFPRVRLADPLQEGRLEDFAPCGVVAGIYARTDTERGIWKAPAGTEAGLRGVLGLSIAGTPGNLIDGEVGQLNPVGVNCLRGLPVIGHVVWGARTLDGADALASQWKYVPVRRLALYIEESLFRGTQWVVFEPNDEPLWAQIRLNVGAFMNTLFRQGAFQGQTPKDAYFVKCSSETTTQTDIDNGIVNIVVGFAPLKPAEFVVIKIQQISPQQ